MSYNKELNKLSKPLYVKNSIIRKLFEHKADFPRKNTIRHLVKQFVMGLMACKIYTQCCQLSLYRVLRKYGNFVNLQAMYYLTAPFGYHKELGDSFNC